MKIQMQLNVPPCKNGAINAMNKLMALEVDAQQISELHILACSSDFCSEDACVSGKTVSKTDSEDDGSRHPTEQPE